MIKHVPYSSKRTFSLPPIENYQAEAIQREQIKNDLRFLKEYGFITSKFLSKKRIQDLKTREEVKEKKIDKIKHFSTVDVAEDLRESLIEKQFNYNDFKEKIKPSRKSLNHLRPGNCFKETSDLHHPGPSGFPKLTHREYVVDSMKSLKNTNFKIKKSRLYLSMAKQIAKYY